MDRLKNHYKHCIRLSASNKINPKNAFDLQLIDYMQDLVSQTEDGQMNFKIASSALDVGAKIYSNRVDCIQSEAQKVASSILMALDGQHQSKRDDNTDPNDTQADINNSVNSDRMNDSRENDEDGPTKATKKKRSNRNKNIKTVVDDENMLDGKIEKMVLGDAFLDALSQDYDMSCPAALICYNPLTQPDCLLTIESNNSRKNFREKIQPNNRISDISTLNESNMLVSLLTKTINGAQIIRSNLTNNICPRLGNFLFNDRTTTLSGLNSNGDSTNALNASNPNPNLNTNMPTGRGHEFELELYENGDSNDYGDNHFGDGGDEENQPLDKDRNDILPDLDKIAACKPTDYGYSHEHSRLLNTWAGPHAWRAVKVPQSAKKNAAPQSTRKRAKLEQKPINFEDGYLESLEEIVDKNIRHSHQVIRSWRKGFIPEDHNLTGDKVRQETIVTIYNKPEETYHCFRTTADASRLVDKDHDYVRNGENNEGEVFASPDLGGFDDVHDDSDDEFRADPVEGNELAIYSAPLNTTITQQADLEFAGENLIEQPYTVTHINIPFAKIAKKMDVRKLKRVMWDLLLPPEEKRLEFSNLYNELPVRVSSKMACDLSQPIAFVTLLHLANENNLKLTAKEDFKDFVIELA